jgi:hypothetical protein
MQTDVFLGELAEFRQAVADEQTILLGLRQRLASGLADDEAAACAAGTGTGVDSGDRSRTGSNGPAGTGTSSPGPARRPRRV